MKALTTARTRKRSADRSERGASLVEYALLVGLIALVCIVAVAVLGTDASKSFDSNAESLFVR